MKQMRYILTLIIIFNGLCSNSQTRLKYGDVIFDSSFTCNNSDSFNYGINNICKSNNEFELRLESIARPNGSRELIVIGYNKEKWYANKYLYLRGSVGYKRETINILPLSEDFDYKIYNHIFKLTFDTLKNNRIFLLPNQDVLKLDGIILDGTIYKLTYKVNNKYRQYNFNNIESYFADNPKSKELQNYIKITKYMYMLFN